ncbi:hypothetical protein FLM48_20150 [Shewanella sp. Scap07]|uniref:multiheme c-type cytochrome n=1 Tax=Shewanella sp. Scap07 TaxID=2589987 RepID=UPI0015B956B6|nr:hypothetical protein [Shewanella sp. Scap07]QLE87183.1 hypothetical protein FLM48_20150 [Shewanella sp. Scap07]
MKGFNKRYLALIVAGAMGLAGCGSDGKDGEDGAPGEPGPGPNPPVTEMSEVTNITMISHAIEEGQVRYEFEITNEEDKLVEGLVKAEAKFAELTDKGVVLNRDGVIGGYTDSSKEGSELTSLGEGRYEFVAAMPAVTASSEGIVWLRVGGDSSTQIARSQPLVVDKPEMVHTSATETCYSCHVDYSTSSQRHASYTAINVEGDVDFVAGCLVCHNNVSRAEESGGYANATLQQIGHINHQKFEKDFTPTNCYTCHAEPVINTSIAGNGCNDCHTSDSAATQAIAANSDFDAREFHAKSLLIGLEERQTIRAEHSTTLSAIYLNEIGEYCTDLKLFKGEEMLDIEALYADGTLSYASTYLHAYNNESIVGRESRTYTESYNGDGSKTFCHSTLDIMAPQIMASSRVTFKGSNWVDDDSKYGVSFTSYSPVTERENLANETEYDRRHSVTADSCTTCHNNETNYHKNGSYTEGGLDCVACHNNGQDRSSANSAPGFGPMVHSMHWGVGASAITGEPNSATQLNAENCVACHADGIDLYAIPNQFIRAKAFHNGDSTKMASPITANCFACHNDDSALNHMVQQGGSIDEEVVADWYTQPTSESCATCHAEGKSYGIEKFHVFER